MKYLLLYLRDFENGAVSVRIRSGCHSEKERGGRLGSSAIMGITSLKKISVTRKKILTSETKPYTF